MLLNNADGSRQVLSCRQNPSAETPLLLCISLYRSCPRLGILGHCKGTNAVVEGLDRSNRLSALLCRQGALVYGSRVGECVHGFMILVPLRIQPTIVFGGFSP